MAGQIRIQYGEVYSRAGDLRGRIETELREMDAAYNQILSDLNNLDSATNAAFMDTMVENRRKAQMTADCLRKLINFIENSARQVEQDEQRLANVFASPNLANVGRGGVR